MCDQRQPAAATIMLTTSNPVHFHARNNGARELQAGQALGHARNVIIAPPLACRIHLSLSFHGPVEFARDEGSIPSWFSTVLIKRTGEVGTETLVADTIQ